MTATPVPETVMREKCQSCAMRPGTEAAQSPLTQHLFKLCVLSGAPFECHDGGAGHLCHGFIEAFTAKLRNGDYDRLPKWKRRVYLNLIEMIHDFREAVERGEPFDAAQQARLAAILDDCDAEESEVAA